ncbi:patatin-like phospholipase family protein [Roseomonas sp. AR75]|uniref:patatin-like phospholipase family protein n=1 Tax=Roseomonas sp. AR75 TaxID=2562311 RepID=UPI0010BFEE0F|nr:patatin-like phospholipase family protein [Roseomonas sp. AR75]
MSTTEDPPPFEIGIVAAGAVSAGAYTAGVLDLLFEAMDAFEAAREAGLEGVPTHRVMLRAMVGASAGAMNAATVAAWANRSFEPMSASSLPDAAARRSNPFAWAWVDQPHITRLLDTTDLDAGQFRSVLNGAWLSDAVDQILSPDPQRADGLLPSDAPKHRGWIADLRVRMTVGNLTGTPYTLTFEGGDKVAGGMMDHAEVMDFLAMPTGAKPPASYLPLPGDAARGDPTWASLGEAALASGAFPGALPARALSRLPENRARRPVFVPRNDPDRPNEGVWEVLEPDWNVLGADRGTLLCVDGGIANNEPTDLCRDALLIKRDAPLSPKPAEATQAMIMVDPFPDPPTPGPRDAEAALPRILSALITAWKDQARFRPVDIWLATQSDVFSRQIIAPSAEGGGRPKDRSPLAGGALGGFLGFFCRDFREHDFLLGRHNCRSFLQHYFTVPVDNVVVRHWACTADGAPTPLALRLMREHGLDEAAGKVPLVWLAPHLRDPRDPAKDPVPQPAWPVGRFRPAELEAAFAKRIRRVLRALSGHLGSFGGALTTGLGWLPAWLGSRRIVALLEEAKRDSNL